MIYYRKTLFGCGPKLTAVHSFAHTLYMRKAYFINQSILDIGL